MSRCILNMYADVGVLNKMTDRLIPPGSLTNECTVLWRYATLLCLIGPVCEQLSTYFNLPQPSVVLIQCVSP